MKIPKRIDKIITELIDQYEFSDKSSRSWIIGFSGGKDSTVLLTLVWMCLNRLKESTPNYKFKRDIYVVCNDTLVENPIISNYVDDVLSYIEKSALEQNLPIFIKKTSPKLDETFWINVIGRGYPVPNNTFRWCTDRLKIRPTANFLHNQVDEKGEAIVLLGTRYDESKNRERSIKKHEVKNQRLSPHNSSPNTMTYSPIKELQLEEIWYIINTFPSPWNFDNSILFRIYADANSDDYECPTVVTSKEHKSCGQSRFGCWTCTVVQKDKSMSSLIDNGQSWLTPLLTFRNQLQNERNEGFNRRSTRRNGQVSVSEDGVNQGNYTPEYRYSVLKRLLEVQKKVQLSKPEINLISNQELIAIQVLWNRDLFFNKTVTDLYKEVYGIELITNNFKSISKIERKILKEECEADLNLYRLIDNLISIQESKSLLVSNYGLNNEIEKLIESKID
ncbi:MAG: DNA phosphorothioation system sulfurtransferase DndC [Flavobacteriaceae bacterium]|nr:DNA phosphorothioation system sulfurtransferase DndC [Flavobacteriaceae bacterium]